MQAAALPKTPACNKEREVSLVLLRPRMMAHREKAAPTTYRVRTVLNRRKLAGNVYLTLRIISSTSARHACRTPLEVAHGRPDDLLQTRLTNLGRGPPGAALGRAREQPAYHNTAKCWHVLGDLEQVAALDARSPGKLPLQCHSP